LALHLYCHSPPDRDAPPSPLGNGTPSSPPDYDTKLWSAAVHWTLASNLWRRVANASLARFSTPSGVALRHRNSRRTSTTTYDRRRRQKSFSAHSLLAPVRGFQFGGVLTSSRHRRQKSFLAHRVRAPARGTQLGGALTSSLSQFGGAPTEHAIRGDCGYSAALTGDRF